MQTPLSFAISCTARLADSPDNPPPIILIHGAANSAAVWLLWQSELNARGWSSFALDLRGHGQRPPIDLSSVRMADYADDVRRLIRHLNRPPVLIGWSMGGLVAMMVAERDPVSACVTLAPSLPAEREETTVVLRHGVISAKTYGISHTRPEDQPAMPDLTLDERRIALRALGPESQYARDERRRGIIIRTLSCPLLIVTGTRDNRWPGSRYANFWISADRLSMQSASHWGLVLNQRALCVTMPMILTWLKQAF